LGLLGQDGRRESGHPLLVDPRLGGHFIDRVAGAQPRLHLAWGEAALRAGGLRDLERQPRLTCLPGPIPCGAVPESNGFLDTLQEALVNDNDKPAGLGAFARAEDQPVMVRRKSDEVKLLHTRPQGGRGPTFGPGGRT
jgi:hypothetical protein